MNRIQLIQDIIKNDESQIQILLQIANDLYRENGSEQIKYKTYIFFKKDILFEDAEYDRLKYKYSFNEEILNSKNRPLIKQSVAFGTLEKFNSSNLQKYVKRMNTINYTKTYILTPKFDGCSLRIVKGKTCITRHDFEYGIDITNKCTNLFKDYNIPKNSIIRGELITLIDHENYVNKRSYVSSHINDTNLLPDDIIFIPYEYLEFNNNQLSDYKIKEQFKKLKSIFNYNLQYQEVTLPTINILLQFFKQFSKDIPVDGIVIKPNGISFEDIKQPKYSIAYKFEQVKYKTQVNSIQWQIKQQGFLVPTILLESITIENSIITKCAGNSFKFLYENSIYPTKDILIHLNIVPVITSEYDKNISKELFIQSVNPIFCPNCQSKLILNHNSVYLFQCPKYYQKCCFKVILMKVRAQTDIIINNKKLGQQGIIKLVAQSNFNLKDFFNTITLTDKQLFIILSENVGSKNIDKQFDLDKLNDLKKQFNID